jgi:hypothetical protein
MLSKKHWYIGHQIYQINGKEKRKGLERKEKNLRILGLYPKNPENRDLMLTILEIVKPKNIAENYGKYFDKTDIELVKTKVSEYTFEKILYRSGAVNVKLYKKLNFSSRDLCVDKIVNRTYENMYKLLRCDPHIDEFNIGIPYTKPKSVREKKYKEKLENLEGDIDIFHPPPHHSSVIYIWLYVNARIHM